MAVIGLKNPIYSKYAETNGTITYNSGKVMAKAIKADLSIDIADAILYADDGAAESVKQFSKGTIALQVDDLEDEVKADLYGHKLVNAEIEGDSTTKMLVAGGGDTGAYVGVGFYASRVVQGVIKYRAIWLTKVQFGIPAESYETKGEKVSFQTPTTTGTIMLNSEGDWKKEVTVDTEATARVWLNSMANIA
ncbi:major tail protein [Ruminiclostridium cellobioparum]|uniref:Phage major tail protein, phi13 family n=1 Tax=Ruminiclostridium cellobioparum subsp. termitidis CT1112 TaxID=1195236 RepID=S0FUN2_RUMCE|nr:major tail protein [Ruminiclostridium cellobioparum]EMS74026.1 phage major tail protein, phi13 family [Ruminiclostridium cellobioparum subsp. termitidis CT1112]